VGRGGHGGGGSVKRKWGRRLEWSIRSREDIHPFLLPVSFTPV